MGVLDLLIHLTNFFLPAVGMAVFLPLLSKLVWWKQLRGDVLRRMAVRIAGVSAVVLVAGFALTGRDGAMLTYAALVTMAALTAWWTGLR